MNSMLGFNVEKKVWQKAREVEDTDVGTVLIHLGEGFRYTEELWCQRGRYIGIIVRETV